jgi:5-methyltetrahydropteroyltriglutamate--homocysteine methyltransferase
MITTVIGSYPKPSYITLPDWFKKGHRSTDVIKSVSEYLEKQKADDFAKAIEEVIKEQNDIGIDIITDGEIKRENYIYGFCRTLENIDFDNLTTRELRNGVYKLDCPTITGKLNIKNKDIFYSHEWYESNEIAKKYNAPLKFTLPGPMTICGTLSNIYYENEYVLCKDIVPLLRREILYLKSIGCKNIQIDEPLFARESKKAILWGIDLVNEIVKDIDNIFFTLHICCGYPTYLDEVNYLKADHSSYRKFIKILDKGNYDAISIEDGHIHQDLSFLTELKEKKIILGVIDIANSKIESVESISIRIHEALKYIDQARLIIAPDCGLGFLPKDILHSKLKNMVAAVKLYE